MTTEKISVVVPIHNGAQWIRQTLDSIFRQTYQNFEIILVNDASTDGLNEILNSVLDPRLHIVNLDVNIGVSAARNLGIDLATGGFIAFCDADDVCQPDRFERQISFLKKNFDAGLCGSAFTCFSPQERKVVINPVSNSDISTALMRGNCFGLSTVMARASVLKTNHFDESLMVAEDYDLWTRLASSGVMLANLPESLLDYRLHDKQASRNQSAKLDHVSRRIRSRYCASLLHNFQLQDRMNEGSFVFADIETAALDVLLNTDHEPRDFRFMLAWMYQRLDRHSVWRWWRWCQIQHRLQLRLDRNYRMNTAILAFLPISSGSKFFDTLAKLKR